MYGTAPPMNFLSSELKKKKKKKKIIILTYRTPNNEKLYEQFFRTKPYNLQLDLNMPKL